MKNKCRIVFTRMMLSALFLCSMTTLVRANGLAGDSKVDERVHGIASPHQTQITVTGTVADHLDPIIGANIIEKGTSNGTVTDLDGNFSLTVSPNAVLVVTYIGYLEQEITVGNKTLFNILLEEDTQSLDEVVIVGYGVQKKVNMTGSVSSINVSELSESRPITNVSQALSGMAAGVQISSSSNQPGNDNASIRVRGQGTLNSSAPLVIVDGIEAGINTVNPQDIESMSVLKDAASAAIYGSRAANGVILITTKQGKAGTLKIDYNGYVSSQSIRNTLTPVSNYADYMELVNEGMSNSKQNTFFSKAMIDEWRNDGGKDPLRYPNTNWIEETFKPSTSTNHVVSMSGGSEKIRFYSSFGYLNNPGVMENTGFERFNGRFNLEADVKKWLKVGAQISGYLSNMDPAAKYKNTNRTASDTEEGPTTVDLVFMYASATSPGMVFRAPDGRYGAMNNSEDAAQSANNNPLIRLNSVEGIFTRNNVRSRFFGTITPFEGFSVTASYLYEFTDEQRESKPRFNDGWNFKDEIITYVGKSKSNIYNFNGKQIRNFSDLVARYETTMADGKLDIGVMAGASQEQYLIKGFSAKRDDLIDMSLGVIDGATGESVTKGKMSTWAMRSYFGRINLGWDHKYLLEMNLRADQSSRFLSNLRTGYFPSVSAGWRIDQEGFMDSLTDRGLSNLKLRLSYGSLGNNSVGNYDAISVYSPQNYVYGGGLALGLAQTGIANAMLTWESTSVTDIGLDFGLLNNRFTGTIDYFNKRTNNILIDLPAPAVHGNASIPKQNSAIVTNQGVELTLGWHDRAGDFSYFINGNVTYVKNIVNKYKGEERTINGANVIQEGLSINSQYLLRVDRILQTDDDMKLVEEIARKGAEKGVNPFAAFRKPEKGDLLYKDLNGDGVINNEDKEVVSAGPNPLFSYGLNVGGSYKGIDLSVLLQGVAGVKMFWREMAYNTPTVRHGYQMNKEVTDGRWTPGRTDATYPRLLEYKDGRNTEYSDFYLQDKSFLKIRNIQLGYTLPKSILTPLQLEKLRIYASLENYFTFTKYKGFDPEVSGMNYPSMKQAVVGINITF